jgi:hypothetical protein
VNKLETSNIKLLNEITKMKKREMYILNGKDPDEISEYRLEMVEVEPRKQGKVPTLNFTKIDEWREKDYLASLLRK